MSDLVLVFDDETDEMQDWWEDLRDAGMTVVETSTTSDLIAQYHAGQPDLIILDRMPGVGDNYQWRPAIPGVTLPETLLLIHRDIRRSTHLRHAPIIVFTNYVDRSLAATMTAMDRRVIMLGKDTLPSELRVKAQQMIQKHRYPKGAASLDHPDQAAYHVRADGQALPVRFVPCEPREHTVFRDGGEWRFREIFAAYLDGDAPQELLKLVILDETERVLGLLYLGGEDSTWIADVTFETAPHLRYGAPGRAIVGAGQAMLARVVMEYLYRQNLPPDTFLDGLVDLPAEFALHLMRSADLGFFDRFELRVDEQNEWRRWIDSDAARRILQPILHP